MPAAPSWAQTLVHLDPVVVQMWSATFAQMIQANKTILILTR